MALEAPQPSAPSEQKPEQKNILADILQEQNGLKGVEKLDKIEALRDGPFRTEYLDKVIALKSDQKALDAMRKKLEGIENDDTKTPEQKTALLREGLASSENTLEGMANLFAILGKNIEFGDTSMKITFDFGKLNYAEDSAVGAGHILPPNVQFITTENGKAARRTIGKRGGEYRTGSKYTAVKSETTVVIEYKDIMKFDDKKMAKGLTIEKELSAKHLATAAASRAKRIAMLNSILEERAAKKERVAAKKPAARQEVAKAETTKPEVKKAEVAKPVETPKAVTPEQTEVLNGKLPAPPPSLEFQETPRPTNKLAVIGDSQVEGLGSRLGKEGIPYSDLRGFSIRGITEALNNPLSIARHFRKRYDNPEKQAQYDARMHSQIAHTEKVLAALTTAERVFIQCGGNNIHDKSKSVDSMKRDFTALISAIKEKSASHKDIFVGYLMPSGTALAETEGAKRAEFNLWLFQQAKAGKFKLVDTYRNVADRSNPSLRDEALFQGPRNAHLKSSGYTMLAEKTLRALNYQPNAATATTGKPPKRVGAGPGQSTDRTLN